MFKKIKYKVAEIFVENITKRWPINLLPDKYAVVLDYFLVFGKLPNLTAPKSFSEKLQWIKINGNLEQYSDYADKYSARKYVKEKIGSKYLVPLLGVWDKFEDINFDKLPKKFVLKATHGSGSNFICQDKTKINLGKLKIKINYWLNDNYYENILESQYKFIKPRIICEKYMEEDSGGLIDYKFYCYDGVPKYLEIHLDRFTNHRTLFVDMKWKRIPIFSDREPSNYVSTPDKPHNLKEMIRIATKLSVGFPFVRVDLYSIKGKTYFGEMTFVPANGLLKFTKRSADLMIGKSIKIEKYNPNYQLLTNTL